MNFIGRGKDNAGGNKCQDESPVHQFKSGVKATAVQDDRRFSCAVKIRDSVVECGGKRSATPLSTVKGCVEVNVFPIPKAVSRPPQSKTAGGFPVPSKFAGASWSAAAGGARRRFFSGAPHSCQNM
jgi:hypothetical protein